MWQVTVGECSLWSDQCLNIVGWRCQIWQVMSGQILMLTAVWSLQVELQALSIHPMLVKKKVHLQWRCMKTVVEKPHYQVTGNENAWVSVQGTVDLWSYIMPNIRYHTPGLLWMWLLLLVYDLRTQSLNFIAPTPEQVGTTTMHFSAVSGGTSQMHCGGF